MNGPYSGTQDVGMIDGSNGWMIDGKIAQNRQIPFWLTPRTSASQAELSEPFNCVGSRTFFQMMYDGYWRYLTILIFMTAGGGFALNRRKRKVKDDDQATARRRMHMNRHATKASKRIGRNDLARTWRRRKKCPYLARKDTIRSYFRRSSVVRSTACVVVVCSIIFISMYAQWNPYNSVKIGDASKPGPAVANGTVVIVSRNIHGIYSNLMSCIRTKADVICIQEADIAESDVMDFHEQAATAGYKCKWGEPIQLSKTSGGRDGRRVAMLVKHLTKVLTLDDNEDDNTQYLRATGRWMECMIPVSDGRKQIIIACLYGISGSNCDNSKYDENERLVAAALVRMDYYKDIAYYICTDSNVDPQTSAVLTKA